MRKEELSEFIFQAMQTFDNAHVMVWFEVGLPAKCFAVGTKFVAVGTFEDYIQPKLLLKEVKDIEKIALLYDNGDMETLYPQEERMKIETKRNVKCFRGRVIQCRGIERDTSGFRYGWITMELEDGTECEVWMHDPEEYNFACNAHAFNLLVWFVAEVRDIPRYYPLLGLRTSIPGE